jgi:hypothetical protein
MALEGSIKDFSLADIFQLIGIQRKTGVLTLQNQDEEVKVSFLNGMVVNADSKSKRLDDRLGSVLVKTGKIDADGLKRALKIQRETLKKIGVVLIEENLVRPEDLREALGIQITQIIYRLFRWKDGDYHFEQDVSVDFDKENFTPMSAESILMEGMRMIDEWPIIERKITSFDLVFEQVPLAGGAEPVVEDATGEEEAPRGKEDEFDDIFGGDKRKKAAAEEPSQRIKLSREENIVYQQVNGEATVQEIVERTMLSEFEICRALYDLTNRNLIASASGPVKSEAPRPAKRVDVGGFLAKGLQVALFAAVIAAALLQGKNRFNLLTPPAFESPQFEPLRQAAAISQVRRVAEAIDTFAHVNQSLPGAPADLLRDGLLDPGDLVDPWGRPLSFEVRPDGIVVSCPGGAASDAPPIREERTDR